MIMNTEELKRLAEPLASPNGSDSNVSWWDAFHRAANPAAILELISEIDSLRDQVNGLTGELESERKRLDFSLNREGFYDHTTHVFFCDRAFKISNPQVRIGTDDPRATIDELMG